jgi:pyruvate/oxaloacetate carboxyltransferase
VGYRHYPDVVIRFVEKAAREWIDIFGLSML